MKRFLWAILLLAVAARIASALYQGNEVVPLSGAADQVSYHELSRRVLEGHGFSFGTGWWPATAAGEPTAHWSYVYVLYLTGVYALFGIHPIAARLIQAVLTGILQPLLSWSIGRRLFGPRSGLVAAALTSFYPYFVFYGGALMTESLYIVAILWILDISIAMTGASSGSYRVAGMRAWIFLGLACGMAVLLRQVFLLLVPAVLVWIAWRLLRFNRSLSARQAVCRFALSIAVLLACIAPWTIRNYKAFGTFVLLNTNSGFAFFWGNHPVHGTDFIPILPSERYGALIPEELRGLNEAEMDNALRQRGFDFIREDPRRYLLLSLSRAREYFKFWPEAGSSSGSNRARMLSFGLILPLTLWGMLRLVISRFREKETCADSVIPGASLLVLTGGLYTLLHLMTWTLIRYRLPVDAMFMPFAALGAVFIYDALYRRGNTNIERQRCGTCVDM